MKTTRVQVLTGFFLVVCIVVSFRVVSGSSETLREARERLELKRIEYKTENVGKLGLWGTMILYGAGSLAAAGAVCGLVLSFSYGLGIIREKSLVSQKIGNSELHVHYRTIKQPEFAAFMTGTIQIEGVRAQNPEKAIELTERFISMLPRMAGRMPAALPMPEQTALPAAAFSLPKFREVLTALEPGDQMYLGTDTTTRESIRGTFDDLYSSFFAGESGSGKSSWLRGIMAQSLICYPGVRFHILDPHKRRKDSLTASLPGCEAFVLLDDVDPTQGLYAFGRLLQGRIDSGQESFAPLVFVCDELNYCSKQKYAVTLQTLFDRIATEGRKVNVYLLVSSQDTRMKKGLDFRDTLASSYVFKLKTRQASYLLQDTEETAKHKAVKEKGEALLNMTTGESRLVKVPHCSIRDMQYFQAEFMHQANGPDVTDRENSEETLDDVSGGVTTTETGGPTVSRLSRYMQQTGLSLSQTAKATGINKGYLSQVLNGKKPLSDNAETTLTEYLTAHEPAADNVVDLDARRGKI